MRDIQKIQLPPFQNVLRENPKMKSIKVVVIDHLVSCAKCKKKANCVPCGWNLSGGQTLDLTKGALK